MSDGFLESLLRSDKRIRMVTYLKDFSSKPRRVSRGGLVSIDAKNDEAFTTITVPAVLGALLQFEGDFGKLRFVGGMYGNLNFVFFSRPEGIYIVSYDKVPMEEIVENLEKVLN